MLVSAYLADVHGVCGDDIAISHLLLGVHDPHICLLVMHHGRAVVRPPSLLQSWQHLQRQAARVNDPARGSRGGRGGQKRGGGGSSPSIEPVHTTFMVGGHGCGSCLRVHRRGS